MRKIKIMEHVSLDGIIEQGDDYAYGNWTMPYGSQEGFDAVMEAHSNAFDLLLGRVTYDLWAGYWPHADNQLANGINAATKYVATHRPDSLEWGPVEDLGADIVEGVRRMKSSDGPDVILWGSSTLTSVLLDQGLIDEIELFVYPVLLGKGKRFFSDTVDARELSFVSTKVTSKGVFVNTYRYVGALKK